jgi:hypothetical protein
MTCSRTKWKSRPALRITNGSLELVTLTGGGAIADLRLSTGPAALRQNVLWEAPWASLDPDRYQAHKHRHTYGPEVVGRFLAGFTGHSLCLDYFGLPSESEAREGLCLHGEASVRRWKVVKQSRSKTSASVLMEVQLPHAGLKLRREFHVRSGETVVYVSETLLNLRATDHFFHWTQHVTLGPPFLQPGESAVCVPAQRGITWPHGYEGKSLLAQSKEFTWPLAPHEGGGVVDITQPFLHSGKGFVASVLLDLQREWGFIAALNFNLGLVVGYCFPRILFPWVTIWEENQARLDAPWKGNARARGVEFGTTPMPVGKKEVFASGPLFGTPTFQCIPAKGRLQTSYFIFLSSVNTAWREIRDVELGKQAITLAGDKNERIKLPARDLETRGNAMAGSIVAKRSDS